MLIERLQVQGLLSFGPRGIDLPLEPLNVLIGPNGSGKSNLLQVLGLLRDAAGGPDRLLAGRDWEKLLWQGPPYMEDDAPAKAILTATSTLPEWEESLAYSLKILEGLQISETVKLSDDGHGDKDVSDDSGALEKLRRRYGGIRLYQNWEYGELAGLISRFSSERKDALVKRLGGRLYDGIAAVHTPFDDGKVSVVIEEFSGRRIPAEQLSDGTLRYLCLLTILLDPDPPPLIAIEEPEVGLHPDIVFELTKLLVEASERTQLVVTTHSYTLVDMLTDHPSSVVACERHQGQTWLKRVSADVIEPWMDEQSLGEVWCSGGIGGNPW